MALDNLNDLNLIEKPKINLFQKLALSIEIALLVLGIVSFFVFPTLLPRIIIIILIGSSFLYVFLPILLFKSKTGKGHIFSHIVGLLLFMFFVGLLFRIASWPYASEMQIIALVPMVILLILLVIVNFKEKDKLDFYLRIGLRFIIMLMFFMYFY